MTFQDYAVPLSAVVIARDEERRIGCCLDSIRAARPQEVIVVVDDRSRDRTAAIAAEKADRVITVHGLRGKLRNIGWRAAQSDFICFIDADHLLPPEYFQTLYSAINQKPRTAMVGAPLKPIGSFLWERLAWMIWDFRRAFGTGGSLYRRTALESVGGFRDELHAGEDGELSARFVSAGWLRVLTNQTFSYHAFPRSYESTKQKLRYGAAGGVSSRSLLRILLSFPAALIMAFRYNSGHILWYCPWRAIFLVLWGGRPPSEYHPKVDL